MEETYCGKNCETCSERATLHCPGCKLGPGRDYGGDCSIAKCCREKGHTSCVTCSFKGNCGPYQGRFSQPQFRREKAESGQKLQENIRQRASILAPNLMILFWLFVPSVVSGLFTNQQIKTASPKLYLVGELIGITVSIIYSVILIRMASVEELYQKAGILKLCGSILNFFTIFPLNSSTTPTWTLLISIPALILIIVGTYHEFQSHSSVLRDVDYNLSDNWEKLWKIYLGSTIALFVSPFIIIILPIIGLLLMAASAVVVIVASILRLIYLYRTANIFKTALILNK